MRQGRRTLGASYADRLTDRHVAYLAFHMFQLHDQSQRQAEATNRNSELTDETGTEPAENASRYEPDSTIVTRELERVAATLIQTLKSESELMRLEAEAVNQD